MIIAKWKYSNLHQQEMLTVVFATGEKYDLKDGVIDRPYQYRRHLFIVLPWRDKTK